MSNSVPASSEIRLPAMSRSPRLAGSVHRAVPVVSGRLATAASHLSAPMTWYETVPVIAAKRPTRLGGSPDAGCAAAGTVVGTKLTNAAATNVKRCRQSRAELLSLFTMPLTECLNAVQVCCLGNVGREYGQIMGGGGQLECHGASGLFRSRRRLRRRCSLWAAMPGAAPGCGGGFACRAGGCGVCGVAGDRGGGAGGQDARHAAFEAGAADT